MIIPIINTLSFFELELDVLEPIVQNLLQKLETAELDQLPVMIQFLFQTATSDSINNVLVAKIYAF